MRSDPPAAWRGHAACGAQHGPRRAGGDGNLRGRYRVVGSEGASCSTCRWRCCWAGAAMRCRSTAAAASPATATGELRDQLAAWVERDGCRWVKMKVGTEPERDPQRVRGGEATRSVTHGLFVDANGAYSASRRWSWRTHSREQALPGSRSRCRPTIWQGLRLAARPRAGRDGNRRRRIWLHDRLFPPNAGCWRGRCAAGRRHALRWRHRLAAGGRVVRGAPHRFVRSLCALRCICMPPAPRRGFGTSNGSTTMCASSTCCSMARRRPRDGVIRPDLSRPGMGLDAETQRSRHARMRVSSDETMAARRHRLDGACGAQCACGQCSMPVLRGSAIPTAHRLATFATRGSASRHRRR